MMIINSNNNNQYKKNILKKIILQMLKNRSHNFFLYKEQNIIKLYVKMCVYCICTTTFLALLRETVFFTIL